MKNITKLACMLVLAKDQSSTLILTVYRLILWDYEKILKLTLYLSQEMSSQVNELGFGENREKARLKYGLLILMI
jgi:hypothetical protein